MNRYTTRIALFVLGCFLGGSYAAAERPKRPGEVIPLDQQPPKKRIAAAQKPPATGDAQREEQERLADLEKEVTGFLSTRVAAQQAVVVAASRPSTPFLYSEDDEDDVVIIDPVGSGSRNLSGALATPLPPFQFPAPAVAQLTADDARHAFLPFCLLTCGEYTSYNTNPIRPFKALADHRQYRKDGPHQNCEAVCAFTIKCVRAKTAKGHELLHCPLCDISLSTNPRGYVKHMGTHKSDLLQMDLHGNYFAVHSNVIQITQTFS